MLEFIVKILFYIIVYSVAGWILESVYKTIVEKRFVNSGFLTGPVCPIYGIGAFIMLISLGFLKDNILPLFIVAFIILSIWEYMVGFILEKLFKAKYWDYSHLRFNYKGRICLKNSIYWGILGVFFIQLIHPFVDNLINSIIPFNAIVYLDILFYIILVIDIIGSSINVLFIRDWDKRKKEMEDDIKKKINDLRTQKKLKQDTKNSKIVIRKLKLRQTKIKIGVYKTAKRLKNAFPSMKSERITEFTNQKVDMEALKKYIRKLQTKIMKK